MSDKKNRPPFDEQTLGKVLEAAYVVQEHNRELQKHKPEVAPEDQAKPKETLSEPPFQPPQTSLAAASDPGNDYSLALAQIVSTQREIQVRNLDLESALAVVTQRAAEIAKASGAALAIADGNKVGYRAASGASWPALGSDVALEKALCSSCLRTGQAIRCADVTELPLHAEECHRRGIQALIAVPVYREGQITGALELYFAAPRAISDQEVHACQLMAGIASEALARDSALSWKKSIASERATMLDALEKLKPNLAALVADPAPRDSSSTRAIAAAVPAADHDAMRQALEKIKPEALVADPTPVISATSQIPSKPHHGTFVCRKCGHELMAEEQFCGKCGLPRTNAAEPASLQSKVAAMWQMQQASKEKTTTLAVNEKDGQDTPSDFLHDRPPTRPLERNEPPRREEDELPAVFVLPHDSSAPEGIAPAASVAEEPDAADDPQVFPPSVEGTDLAIHAAETALAKTSDAITWSSAARTLEQMTATRKQTTFASFWNARRGDIYLAVAVVLVAGVIRWAVWSNHSASASASAATAAAHRRPAPDADLSLFDKLLIGVGLAEAPDAPEYKGNPDTQVWVDLQTALYYCPGSELYGKSPKGKFTTQHDAQLDQFEPAARKACN